jgi:LPS export ABC transporter permease LptG/LPS export ABC transporter permease LptF
VLVYPLGGRLVRTLDRYLIREIVTPFVIALIVLTFVLEIPVIIREAEALVARGVEWSVIARVLLTLLPQALSLTIPMAVLIGILVGFGRIAGDREFVALQACGVSLMRLLWPVGLVAAVTTAATAHQTIVALPNANQAFREIVYSVMASRVESNVRPRVFFDDFPNRVIYVRDLPAEGGWKDVFFADAHEGTVTVYFAREGQIALDREKRLVQLQLVDGVSHSTRISSPDSYESSAFERMSVTLDPETVFPRPPAKGAPEMTFAELRTNIAAAAARGDPAHNYRFMAQQKLSLPAACPILALIALALSASNRKDGKLASVALGIAVIFVYYVLLWAARAAALGGRVSPEWGPWIPNIVMGIGGVALMAWRARSADRPIRFSLPAMWRRTPAPAAAPGSVPPRPAGAVVVIRLPHLSMPLPRLLDLYIARDYAKVFLLGAVGLLGVFYIATFIDLADKLFRGEATSALLLRYFFFQTPQFVYFVIPMAVLVATLVTVGLLAKNSELTVMRACGISLYRIMAPILLFAAAGSAVLFAVEERVLAVSNREADRLNRVIRGLPAQSSVLNRQWVAGTGGEMYRFDDFDPGANRFSRLWVYYLDQQSWGLDAIAYAESVTYTKDGGSGARTSEWLGRQGWLREFAPDANNTGQRILTRYTPFEERRLQLDSPGYFTVEAPDAAMMTYGQLREYITQLQSGGTYAARYMVSLQRKIAFPFVTVIMTMIAIPFAVATGRRGALYGIGVGIVLAIVYYVALSLFGALGEGGMLGPILAAWAPNILFGAAALYMLLTVRT